MRGKKSFSVAILWVVAALLLFTNNAMAYVGPGAGMEFVGYAMSLLTWMGVAFFSVLLWPVYSFLQWWRGKKVTTVETTPSPEIRL